MLIVIAGDAHGNRRYMNDVVHLAHEVGAELVIQIGDYGFWPRAHRYVSDFRKRANILGISLWVIPGNHDYPGAGRRDDAGYLGWETNAPSLGDLAVIARGATFDIGSVRFGAMGGGISIDRDERTLGHSYWIEEQVSDADVAVAVSNGPVDIWLTHDAVDVPPVMERTRFRDIHLQHDINVQCERMRTIFETLRPKLHVHGHFHVRYSAPTEYGKVIGLADESIGSSCLLVDTKDFRSSNTDLVLG